MRRKMRSVIGGLMLLATISGPTRGEDSILSAIPSDAMGLFVVHNLAETSLSVDEVAKLVQAPPPGLLEKAKAMAGLQQGVDEQGDAALVLVGTAAEPKHMVLVPVDDFAALLAGLGAEEPTTGEVVEVRLAGTPMVVGRKANYAAFAQAADQQALAKFLADSTNLADSAGLTEWIAVNRASAVLTSRGVKELLPKVTDGIRSVQEQMRAIPGGTGAPGADSLDMYVSLFTAAEAEVDQFGLGLRMDAAQSIALVKRVEFVPDGKWAQLAANVQPAGENLLGGLPAGPFVMALGALIPEGVVEQLMEFSVKIMQDQPAFQLTPEQAQKYIQLSTQSMQDVQSMRFVMGVTEPGAGLYGNTSGAMMVSSSSRYMENYEKALTAMSELAKETQSPIMPTTTFQHVAMGNQDALEVTMDMQNMAKLSTPGAPDMQQVMQTMIGGTGAMKIYVAPADDHTVVMSYASVDHLKWLIDAYQSKQPGLLGDEGVAKVSEMLPSGAQFVMYISPNGIAQFIRQTLAATPQGQMIPIPEIPECPPLGMAAKVTPQGVDGRLVFAADTLRTIGEVVGNARAGAAGAGAPQE